MKYKLTFALVAALTSTAFAEFKAPLPEFKNEKQLAEWRAEKASEANSQGYAAEDTAFYTGKPYLASSGGYAFRFRSYDPELARWTSEDPSGFPDGANSNSYVNNCITTNIDYEGLQAAGVFNSQVYSISFSVLVYDPTGTITQATLNSWTSSVNSAWSYSGTDKSNQLDLSLNTTASFTLKTGGYYHEGDALAAYDNVITFGGNRANVRNSRVGFFPINVSTNTVIHEVGHFMNAPDAYTDTYSGGVLTGSTPKEGWEHTIMACTQFQASKKDANLVIYTTGEHTHLFE